MEKRDPPNLCELSYLGAEVVRFPVLEIQAVPEEDLLRIVTEVRSCNWIVFSSAMAVELFFEAMLKYGEDWRCFNHARILAVGQKTGQTLREKGRNSDLIASSANSHGILETLCKTAAPHDQVALCRAGQTLPDLTAGLSEARIRFREFKLYDIQCPLYPADVAQKVFTYPFDLVVLTSPLAVANFFRITADAGIMINETTLFACLGVETTIKLKKMGLQPWLEIDEPDVTALAPRIIDGFNQIR